MNETDLKENGRAGKQAEKSQDIGQIKSERKREQI